MMNSKSKPKNDQSNQKGIGEHEEYQRCEFCNVPIYRNPCSDARSSIVFQGRGKVLCNKCAAIIEKMPAEQALRALENAAEIYQSSNTETRK
jgi:Zn-finger protein